MGLLFLFTIVSFGIIILNEKRHIVILPRVEQKMIDYTKNNYSKIYSDLKKTKTKYNIHNKTYYIKYYNILNNNLYFMVKYKNRKITDTYKNDYLEGKTLLTHNEKTLIKNFSNDKKIKNLKIKHTRKLNNYSKLMQDKIINNKDLKKLSIYDISCTINIDKFEKEDIINSINYFYQYILKNNYNPKTYSIVLKNKNNIGKKIIINKLTKKNILNDLNTIISGILNNENLSNYNITYKYNN